MREIRGDFSSSPARALSCIEGTIKLRGTMLPIVDLAEQLGRADVPLYGVYGRVNCCRCYYDVRLYG